MRSSLFLALIAAAALAAACQAPSRDAAPAGGAAGSEQPGTAPGSAAKPAAERARESSTPRPPRPAPIVIPEGTTLPVVLETSLSSSASKAGDTVVGKLVSDVTSGERVLVPAGSELRGRVTAAVDAGRVKGRARLAFVFDTLVVEGRTHEVATQAIDITAGKNHKRDAAIIGGGALAGGIIGAIADGKGGAGKGVLIGGAAGTGAVLATKGKEISLPAGTQVNVKLNAAAPLE